jgi:hypothetical protein
MMVAVERIVVADSKFRERFLDDLRKAGLK